MIQLVTDEDPPPPPPDGSSFAVTSQTTRLGAGLRPGPGTEQVSVFPPPSGPQQGRFGPSERDSVHLELIQMS